MTTPTTTPTKRKLCDAFADVDSVTSFVSQRRSYFVYLPRLIKTIVCATSIYSNPQANSRSTETPPSAEVTEFDADSPGIRDSDTQDSPGSREETLHDFHFQDGSIWEAVQQVLTEFWTASPFCYVGEKLEESIKAKHAEYVSFFRQHVPLDPAKCMVMYNPPMTVYGGDFYTFHVHPLSLAIPTVQNSFSIPAGRCRIEQFLPELRQNATDGRFCWSDSEPVLLQQPSTWTKTDTDELAPFDLVVCKGIMFQNQQT